ncbi:hypothetical protein QTI66_17365 [Variovorax sp. J22R133]|uniref:hypothetical protein n=1 Tax=Variovorax brevis TaxID=3053503 RepID=UPI0025758DA3|nr:hypothetical protein [Variovorax sp. J22R133]MDM0113928.1 hypothetical protein [Variovorax sp. J22R133]
MKPASILEVLHSLGHSVWLDAGDRMFVSAASALHERQRELLRDNRAAIIRFLKEGERVADTEMADILEIAMRVCDLYGDEAAAREEMRADCIATPHHLRADLLDHFRKEYGQRLLRYASAPHPGKGGDP